MPQNLINFQEHLFELEAELSLSEDSKPIYVLYPDETGGNWRIQAVPISPESFESRKALPEAWRGLRDEELSKATGIPGGIFIHASGFIGGEFQCPLFSKFEIKHGYGQEIKPRRELWPLRRLLLRCKTSSCITLILSYIRWRSNVWPVHSTGLLVLFISVSISWPASTLRTRVF